MTVSILTKGPDPEEIQEGIHKLSKKGYLEFIEGYIEGLEKESSKEEFAKLKSLNAQFLKAIKEDTLTLDETEFLIEQALKLPAVSSRDYLLEFLYREKAGFLLRQGKEKGEEALKSYEEALKFNPESPFSWFLKGGSLSTLGRFEEAFQAFHKAYDLRQNYRIDLKEEMLGDLLSFWSYVAFGLGHIGAFEHDSRKLKAGVEEYIGVIENAKAESLEQLVASLPTSEDLESVELAEGPIKDALEEFALAVRLLSIKDPFNRWREFTKEISKVWPEGLSAADAIREQRDLEWNP